MLQVRGKRIIVYPTGDSETIHSLFQNESLNSSASFRETKLEISELEISCTPLSAGMIEKVTQLFTSFKITRLSLMSCSSSSELLHVFLTVVESFQQIKHLECNNNLIHILDEKCMQKIATMSLQQLTFHGKFLSPLSLPVVQCPLSQSIQELDLNGSRLGSVEPLIQFLPNCFSLRRTLFKCSGLTDSSASQIVTALQHLPCLKHLDLMANHCCYLAIQALAVLLQFSTSIEYLNLSYQLESNINIEMLTKALPLSKCLKVLKLAGNEINDSHASHLATSLAQERTVLQHLDISTNSISAKGLKILSTALTTNRHLKYLNLKYNSIFNLCGLDISQNYYMERLDHSCNKRLSSSSKIDYFCRLNEGGRRLLRRKHGVQEGLWPEVLQRLDAEGLYYFLRHGIILSQDRLS
jgi:hypothetical protein